MFRETARNKHVELIRHTRMAAGLQVRAAWNMNVYPTGVKVTNAQMTALSLQHDICHGDGNYALYPSEIGLLNSTCSLGFGTRTQLKRHTPSRPDGYELVSLLCRAVAQTKSGTLYKVPLLRPENQSRLQGRSMGLEPTTT